jgi:protein-disulfide isomerase/uncharacterized membrane protein
MKRYLYILIFLALAGAALSALLTAGYYYPSLHGTLIACGGGLADPCFTVSRSEYGTLFGMPVAAYGLFYYLFVIFTLLVADYAAGNYHLYAAALMLPATAASLAASAVLAALLVRMGVFCAQCAATYAVNALMFAAAVLWMRSVRKQLHLGFRAAAGMILRMESGGPDRRAAYALFIVFAFLLFFAVFSTGTVLNMKTREAAIPPDQVQAHVSGIYSGAPQALELPESALLLGPEAAPVTMVVFTDFLCGACRQFYRVERDLVARYRDRIRIVYYNFPLDRECNAYARHTRYPGSCEASRAFIASGNAGVFGDYLAAHFAAYESIAGRYSPAISLKIASGVTDPDAFAEAMRSQDAADILRRDIELANRYGVNATPTMFINGRRIEGVPPREILEAVIDRELKK